MTYSELLQDPRWQRKRLEILDRDNFTCQYCNSKTDTLNVHHLCYTPGFRPWDYAPHLLITLCQPCHKLEEDKKKDGFNEGKYLLRLWSDAILVEVMLKVMESRDKFETIERIKKAIGEVDNG